jgi:thiol-disulfide isomerase/thioredoxin
MKRVLPIIAIAAFALFPACSRSGVIDASGSASTAASSSSTPVGKKSATPARIAHGERINIKDHIVPGRTTIFDFTSEYCPPCRAIAPAMHKLHANRSDIVVVEVDLNRPGFQGIDWHSPVSEQFGRTPIPHLIVYGPDGTLKAEGHAAYDLVMGMLE